MSAASKTQKPVEGADGSTEDHAAVWVAEPLHICAIQKMTRSLCRSIGLDDTTTFLMIIAVSDFAEHMFIGPKRRGRMELAVVRRKDRLSVQVRADLSGYMRADGRRAGFVQMAAPK